MFLFEQMDPPLRTPRNGSEDGIELIEISSTQHGNSTSALAADANSNTGSGKSAAVAVAYVDVATDRWHPSCAAVVSI